MRAAREGVELQLRLVPDVRRQRLVARDVEVGPPEDLGPLELFARIHVAQDPDVHIGVDGDLNE